MTLNLNRINFGARTYNSTIGRFLSVGPLAEKSYPHSPYNFALNNPINFIDPDGRETIRINGGWEFTGDDAIDTFRQLQTMNNGGGDDKDKNKQQKQPLPIGDIGTDYDGVGDSLPTGLKDVSYYPNLLEELLERGYSESDIEKICSGNVFRVWNKVLDFAKKS